MDLSFADVWHRLMSLSHIFALVMVVIAVKVTFCISLVELLSHLRPTSLIIFRNLKPCYLLKLVRTISLGRGQTTRSTTHLNRLLVLVSVILIRRRVEPRRVRELLLIIIYLNLGLLGLFLEHGLGIRFPCCFLGFSLRIFCLGQEIFVKV